MKSLKVEVYSYSRWGFSGLDGHLSRIGDAIINVDQICEQEDLCGSFYVERKCKTETHEKSFLFFWKRTVSKRVYQNVEIDIPELYKIKMSNGDEFYTIDKILEEELNY